MPRSSESVPHQLASGRTQQKRRTRDALVGAARALIAKGASPTVEDAAAAASISRTTAYRYFANQAELLAAAHPETQVTSLMPTPPPKDVEQRLDIVVREITRLVVDGEARYRTMLRLSLDPQRTGEPLLLRQGRAIAWIDDALAPAELARKERRRLVLAVRAAVGIEALVWLTDVAGLSRTEAVANMRWSARALLRAALAEASDRGRR